MPVGYYGQFGGCFAPETLMAPLQELTQAYESLSTDKFFQSELKQLLKDFVGRPTPLTYAKRITDKLKGGQLYLKREDLAHTGAHKINNALGQALLAKTMRKSRVIAETGAGQHGVAVATVCALLNLECVIYMGSKDMQRQEMNVKRMHFLGARVNEVSQGAGTLKDATSEAMRDWVTCVNSYYLIGSALGPHPYPAIVRDFQRIIGLETRQQILSSCQRLPDVLVACVGGGSNAIGLFHPFLEDKTIKMIGVEAGGSGIPSGKHAARFTTGSLGILQGTKTMILQNQAGLISDTYSISAGLDYPGVGPEHAYLNSTGRVQYTSVTDSEALDAAQTLASHEGILPALESAHALAYAFQCLPNMKNDQIMIVNLSGRGDKDIEVYADARKESI